MGFGCSAARTAAGKHRPTLVHDAHPYAADLVCHGVSVTSPACHHTAHGRYVLAHTCGLPSMIVQELQ